jgi:NADH-quinone oxidoreductase subunit F
MKEQKTQGVLLEHTKDSGPLWLGDYRRAGGYEGLKKALTEMKPADVIAEIQKAGLRGRGGAGYPTWKKWEMVAKSGQATKYLCANAGEHEPGTFKDRRLIQKNPHLLIEGSLIAAYAVGAGEVYLYVNGSFNEEIKIVKKAMAEAKSKGYWGKDILRTGVGIDLKLAPGSGSYVAGEETGMLEVIEGREAKPRQKPPYYPSYMGLYNKPTVVNNAETLANVPLIIRNGADWYRGIGTKESFGTVLFSVSGDVVRPGVYELPLGTPLRTLIDEYGRGVGEGRSVKAVLPGGPSNGFVTEENLDVRLDFESLKAIGSGIGSGGVIVFDDQTCIVRTMLEFERFFARESCGQCPPCQLGTQNLATILQRFENGNGSWDDLAYLAHLCEIIKGRGYCYLVTGAAILLESSMKHFRYEYELHMGKVCPYPPSKSNPTAHADHLS